MKLTKVNTIGKAWFHRFDTPGGKRVYVPCTEKQYRDLGKINPINPTRGGHKWAVSFETWEVDTPTGKLETGQYTIYPDGKLAVNITGYHAMVIEKEFMDGDELSQEGIDFINNHEALRH